MRAITGWLRRHRALASGIVLAIAASVPISIAIVYRGFPVTDVQLDAKQVWVTNGERLMAGRLNRQIEELDASVKAAQPSVDVVQNGASDFLFDSSLGAIQRIDPAYTTLVDQAQMPVGSQVRLGGSTLAILAPDGRLWVVDVADGLKFDPVADKPDAKLGEGASVTVTPKGTVWATSPSKKQLVHVDGVGGDITRSAFTVSADSELTSVGEQPVAFDRGSDSVVRRDGSSVKLPEPGLKVQQAGADNSFVVVATGDGLLEVPLSGSEVREVPLGLKTALTSLDQVSSPVWLNGCAHGAFSGASSYLVRCDGDSAPTVQKLNRSTAQAKLEFRVNKSTIALNDLVTGDVWLVDANLRLVQNWDEVTPPQQSDTLQGDQKSAVQSFEEQLADRSDVNRPPIARDDSFGVRPGRSTILPVLDNDTDPDGDVLTITKVTDIPATIGTLALIDQGRSIQFTPAADAVGTTSFRYTIDDGRPNGVAEANVNVRVVQNGENAPPVATRTTTLQVEAGGTVGYNVLVDWQDPDGDDLFLAGASSASGDDVRFTPDGQITFVDHTSQVGVRQLSVVVSDGTTTATGELDIDVKAAGSLKPTAIPDFATGFVGDTITVKPLDNDRSPSTAPVQLLGVDEVPSSLTVTPNLERNVIAVSSQTAGRYYFKYTVGAGPATSTGLIRVDVVERTNDPPPPVAVKDTAFLRPGEPTIVRVLDNDVSPSGNVLAVQSVDTSAAAGSLSVELLNNTVIRITSSAALTAQTNFTYTISDGDNTAVAGVTVVPVPPIVKRQPPIAQDDRFTVRAGDYISADVLANDYHPDKTDFTLDHDLVDGSKVGDGLAFTSDDGTVRFQAPTEPGDYPVVYRITDVYGETATATATFTVKPGGLDTNQPPVPTPQTARTFAGSSVRIDIPLAGIDPDGDSVVVTGVSKAPTLGYISKTGPTWFEYTPYESSAGTDEFTYEVQDTYGSRALGTIRIGVIPRPATIAPPNAVDDAVDVKPGRTVSVPVLANDSDPNGYPIELSKTLPEVDAGLTAEVRGKVVVVKAPDTQGSYTIRYQIDNGHGGVDTAFVQVNVTDDAKVLYPTAEDYYVPLEDVVGKTSVDVDLAPHISNPGGVLEDLKVSVEGPNAGSAVVDDAAQKLRITPGKTRIAIAYRVTNPIDDTSATAFVVVPPEVSASYSPPPYIDPSLPPQTIEMNGKGSWKLSDILIVPSGRPAILIDTDSITANDGDGGKLFSGNDTLQFTPRKDFRGPAAITFKVTDGKDANDLNGNQATLTLRFTVGNPDFSDTPPTFVAQSVTIEAGEAPLSIDLRQSTDHPNRALVAQMTYDGLAGATRDIQATLNGSVLQVSSDFGVQPGSKTTLTFQVRFKDFTVPGQVTVTTVSSTKPLPNAVTDEAKGQRSKTSSQNVLANDYNPFAAQGKPLTLVAATVENTSQTSAAVSFTPGGDVTVRPDASFIGVVSVVYTVEDATKDPNRRVQGRFLLNVRDVPDKMSPPTIAGEGDQEIQIAWKAPATNGEPIEGYTITWNGGRAQVDASAASYTATGLTNGQKYRFQISARNVLGSSEVSNDSAEASPFGKPTAPGNPTSTGSADGSGTVTLSWTASNGNGRSITGYHWEIAGGPSGDVSGATTQVQTRMPIGRGGERFTVTATAQGGSAASSGSVAQRSPGAPTNPTAATGSQGDKTITLTWGAAQSYGTAVDHYVVIVNGGGERNVGNVTRYSFDGTFDQSYSFTVRAVAGGLDSATAGPSNSVTPRDVPPPDPKVNLAKGAQETCETGGTCYRYNVTLSDFTSNSHNYTAYCGGSTFRTGTFTGNNFTSGFWCGFQDTHIVVDNVDSNHVDFRPGR